MTVKRNTSGLRRGPATAEEGKKLSQAGIRARAEWRAEIDRTEELARADPEAVLMEFYVSLSRALKPLVREMERNPKDPSRNLIDGLRELRQTGVQVLEILRARGDAAPAESILSEMEDRLGSANLGESLFPYVEHPSRPG